MKLLLVDSEVQNSARISDQLQSKCSDWSVVTATTGTKALEILDSTDCEVMVTDLQLKGMHGTELLEKVAQNHPHILRVAYSGYLHSASPAVISTIHRFLPERFEVEQLIEIVSSKDSKQAAAPSHEILEVIGRKGCLPSIPENLVRLNEVLDADDTNLALIAEIVSEDPSLAAKILQLANSAIFGLRYPVKDVNRGVSVVGKSTVRAIAVSNAIFSVAQYVSILSPDTLFDHSFEVAAQARTICSSTDLDSLARQSAISSALLHDVGKIVLVNAFPDEYKAILKRQQKTQRELWQLESETLGVTHQRVGQYLLDQWGIPEDITTAIATHHDFTACAKGALQQQIVFAANWLTHSDDLSCLEPLVADDSAPSQLAEFAKRMVEWRNQLVESE